MIRYSYLWQRDQTRGMTEGMKDRPCAIVLTVTGSDDEKQVYVVPVTHSPPRDETAAIALPLRVKRHLGLDDEPAWIVLDEANRFVWPGPDLRFVPGSEPSSVVYGTLPPRLFAQVRDRVTEMVRNGVFARINRTE